MADVYITAPIIPEDELNGGIIIRDVPMIVSPQGPVDFQVMRATSGGG